MKTKTLLIHNPNCTKSRGAKEILDNNHIKYEVIDYLHGGLSDELLKILPELLDMNYLEMLRPGEPYYQELDLANKELTEKEWIELIKKNPMLLERPIFIHQGKAVIARPSDRVLEIING